MDAGAGRGAKGNLPAEVTSLVGRRKDVAEVRQMLSDSRLVTLVGPGGVGKTRLALGVGTELRRTFPDGVWFIEFAEVRDADLVGHAVTEALHIHHQSARAVEYALADFLRDRRPLLIFDNCEHLISACAELAESLLRGTPAVRILATSRQALGVTGEHCWSVPPLGVPDHDGHAARAREFPALALFEQRAAAAVPGFAITPDNQETVAAICRRLDGLPLAIELAAARLRALSVDELLDRLDNRYRLLSTSRTVTSRRQQTLRGTIDWSFELCTGPERLLWARASVFAGSFDLPAAEAVCSQDGIEVEDVLDLLGMLVEKSIIVFEHTDDGRYRLLETVRSYAQEKLRSSGAEETVRRRHRDWYLELAKQAEREWFGAKQADIIGQMKAEHANLRSALEFCLSTPGEERAGMYLAAVLWSFWHPTGFLSEGRHWLDRALALDPEACPERLKALWIAGRNAVFQDNVKAAMPLLEECRSQAVRLGDESAHAHAIFVIGLAALRNDDVPVAVVLLEEAIARFHAMGEVNGVTMVSRGFLAIATTLQGNLERAVKLCRESLGICEKHGERWARAHVLLALAHAEWTAGETRDALRDARESLRTKRMFDEMMGIGVALEFIGWIAEAEGDNERAARLLGGSQRIWPEVGTLPLYGFGRLIEAREAVIGRLRKALGEAGFDAEARRGAELELDQLIAYALGERVGGRVSGGKGGRRTGKATRTPLTKREREIAELVATGMSNKEIAATLVISQRTAETHVEHILSKLGFTSRAQIAALISEQRVQ